MAFTWQAGRQMYSTTASNGTVYRYRYNDDGIRYMKWGGGVTTNYYLDGSTILAETKSNGTEIIYMHDENGNYVGFILNGTKYYYAFNAQGDVVGIYNIDGEVVARYRYDAWGKVISVTDGSLGAITSSTHVANINPIRYRGYYYDVETGLYYLQSRYYDPTVGRFVNADGYVSTGQSVNGFNMYAYCGNDPVNRLDPTGHFWKEIGQLFCDVWNGVKSWASNTFGAGSSTTETFKIETPIIPDPFPITVKSGTKTTQTISERGDSSKPISVYANKAAENLIISSSVGLNLNIADFSWNLNVGLDDIGVSVSLTNGDTTNSFASIVNLSEFKVGFEGSTAVQWDNKTETTYANASVNGWLIVATCILVTTGQTVSSPSPSYAH